MILDDILAHKRKEVAARRAARPIDDAWRTPRSDARGFSRGLAAPGVQLIAEIKKASPSAGVICEDFDPPEIARAYEAAGAAALSVLTDERYFQGALAFLEETRAATGLPALRKDFIIDAYQVYEANAAGADALLLIVRALDDETLARLLALTQELGMDALVEAHDRDETKRALDAGARIVGVNNRDLATFKTDLAVTEGLADLIAGQAVFVSESGIKTHDDVARLAACGVDAVLVGQSLMQEQDLAEAVRRLMRRE